MAKAKEPIQIKNAHVHNLKKLSLQLQTNELIVFTGVSGSGKSSMAFDTLYAEGQRRYIQSLSVSARRILEDLQKPLVDEVIGLSPTISIAQKNSSKNPRSTIGTITEIYDYLRLLYARIGIAHCPISHEVVQSESKERIVKKIISSFEDARIVLLAPFATEKKGEFKEEFQHFISKGYLRARIDGALTDLSSAPDLDKNKSHTIEIVVDRLKVNAENQERLTDSVLAALELGHGMLICQNHDSQTESFYSTHAYSKKSGLYYQPLEPHDFSFNSPLGMCERCHGLGIYQEFDLEKIIDPEKSIAQDCCSIATSFKTVRYNNIYRHLAKTYGFEVNTPWKKLPKKAKDVFLYGSKPTRLKVHFTHPRRSLCWTDYVIWQGVLFEAHKRLAEAKSETYRKKMQMLLKSGGCPNCQGSRIKPYPASTLFRGHPIHKLSAKTIEELLTFFQTVELDDLEGQIAGEIVREIERRLHFLTNVGLGYLTLDRSAPSLSGGESQRVHLASQVGSGLVGITYILDEPSIGLHPRDNIKLVETLKNLRDAGNTVIVVEHDEAMIRAADRVVDFGPHAGSRGGQILVNGSLDALLDHPHSLTGKYLSGQYKIESPKQVRSIQKEHMLKLIGASYHNLKKVDLTIPLGCMVAITGVSGSGKSSLITDTLYPALANKLHQAKMECGPFKKIEGLEKIDKIIAIDQTPIGRTPRSNPATYIKLFDEIRTLFAGLEQSLSRGFSPGRFSFNVKEGSCAKCEGMGQVRIDMDFMHDCWIDCDACNAKRFDSETLSVHYKGKSIHDVLEMTIEDALLFFDHIRSLKRKLELLCQVGLGYLTLGQSATTLSGGEAQRLKLAKELVRPPSGKTLYILDEPTTGLHFHDIQALLRVCQKLVDHKNTLVIVEHQMDVVKACDWVIDLGPEGGEAGGTICAEGAPKEIAQLDTPTGRALHEIFHLKPIDTKVLTRAQAKDQILIEGASVHNLKSLSVALPRDKLICFTGPSGSGKSSLAFDTIYAEGNRRYIESLSPYARQFIKQSPKPPYRRIEALSATCAIEQKIRASNPRSTLGTMTEIYDYLRLLFTHAGTAYCPISGEKIESITKDMVVKDLLHHFDGQKITVLAPIALEKNHSFEDLLTTFGMQGYLRIRLNQQMHELDDPIAFNPKEKNQIELVIDRLKVTKKESSRLNEAIEAALKLTSSKVIILSEEKEQLFNLAFAVKKTGVSYTKPTVQTFSFNHPAGMCPHCKGLGVEYGLGPQNPLRDLSKEEVQERLFSLFQEGGSSTEEILLQALKEGSEATRTLARTFLDEIPCRECQGARLNPLARNIYIKKATIVSLTHCSILQLRKFIDELCVTGDLGVALSEVLEQLKSRIAFLVEVGVGYLTLSRSLSSLSNGEAQRIHLARQLGSKLRGILYVLDEPSVGLHPHDMRRLAAICTQLKELGNTLIMVEHDPMTLSIADHLVEFGPGAGKTGGRITFEGSYPQMVKSKDSLTGAYLSGRKKVAIDKKQRVAQGDLPIKGACNHNLKNLSLEIPLKVLTCLTGVSGSGKSTLMHDVIHPLAKELVNKEEVFTKVIVIDQNPIGLSSRSDVGTYTDLLGTLRTFYSSLATAQTLGLAPRHFSYNQKAGMCSHCFGLGYKKIEMLFLPPIQVACTDCNGMRLNPRSLSVTYKGYHFGHLLQMSIDELADLFDFLPKAQRIIKTVQSVGLGYLNLGQQMPSLSGGEAQRIKLCRELAKSRTKDILYLLDEPTRGLHLDDIKVLLTLLNRLVDKGNTMVVIEHNLEVIKTADHLFDLGPGAGKEGGQIIASGTVQEVAKNPHSLTARYL